jgi:hypothetical protein
MLRIKCPVCGFTSELDSEVYWNYKGVIHCPNMEEHDFYIELENGALKDSPQKIIIDNPDFKSPPIPEKILEDYREANICFANNASKACVVMCGRALEGLTFDQKAEGKTLYDKIKYLFDNRLISKPLYNAFTKVRTFRNLGAHYQHLNTIKKGDDKKILDITKHVIEHIYILPLLSK